MTILKNRTLYGLFGFVFITLIVTVPNMINAKNYKNIVGHDNNFIQLSTGVIVDTGLNIMWAQTDNGTRPASYPFIKKISGGSMWHHKSNTLGNRIIPVRDIKNKF